MLIAVGRPQVINVVRRFGTRGIIVLLAIFISVAAWAGCEPELCYPAKGGVTLEDAAGAIVSGVVTAPTAPIMVPADGPNDSLGRIRYPAYIGSITSYEVANGGACVQIGYQAFQVSSPSGVISATWPVTIQNRPPGVYTYLAKINNANGLPFGTTPVSFTADRPLAASISQPVGNFLRTGVSVVAPVAGPATPALGNISAATFKIVLPRDVHRQQVTPWWNQLQRDITP